jgi:hypothetical protein
MWKDEVFTVNVNEEQYYIQPVCEPNDMCTKFKVSTDCSYMFTLCMNDNGYWEMEKDVTPMFKDLIQEIGNAIEKHDD